MNTRLGDWTLDNFGWLCGAVAVAAIAALVVAAQHDAERHARLVSQCLADGRKEYECEALLQEARPQIVPTHVVVVH